MVFITHGLNLDPDRIMITYSLHPLWACVLSWRRPDLEADPDALAYMFFGSGYRESQPGLTFYHLYMGMRLEGTNLDLV